LTSSARRPRRRQTRPRPAQSFALLTGHQFAAPELLELALTHASSRGGKAAGLPADNQRLEFLGDRVLGLAIAEILLESYPESTEGDLTNRSQVLVSTTTLADIARELDLAAWIRADAGPGRRAPAFSTKMLADACEAIIGAIFMDGGLSAARSFIERYWRARIEAMAEPPRDPKMVLQEWALERALPLPTYTVTATRGPSHAPVFCVRAVVEGHAPVEAEGSSKRRAEQVAADSLMAQIRGRADE
jgi:ribonuclease III